MSIYFVRHGQTDDNLSMLDGKIINENMILTKIQKRIHNAKIKTYIKNFY